MPSALVDQLGGPRRDGVTGAVDAGMTVLGGSLGNTLKARYLASHDVWFTGSREVVITAGPEDFSFWRA